MIVLVDEIVGSDFVLVQDMGEDVIAEVVGRAGVFRVLEQDGQQHVRVEDVHAHGAGDHLRVVRRARLGGGGFFLKAGDAAGAVNLQHAETVALAGIDEDGGQSNVSSSGEVLVQHQFVIHLVNVVAGEHQHVLGLYAADGIDVLIDGVGGAQVPVVAHALHGRQDLNELAQLSGHHRAPAFADMTVERKRLVLGEDVDPAQVRVDAVGKSDVDNAVVAAKGDRRVGPVPGQGIEALAGAACQQYSQRVFHRFLGKLDVNANRKRKGPAQPWDGARNDLRFAIVSSGTRNFGATIARM